MKGGGVAVGDGGDERRRIVRPCLFSVHGRGEAMRGWGTATGAGALLGGQDMIQGTVGLGGRASVQSGEKGWVPMWNRDRSVPRRLWDD